MHTASKSGSTSAQTIVDFSDMGGRKTRPYKIFDKPLNPDL